MANLKKLTKVIIKEASNNVLQIHFAGDVLFQMDNSTLLSKLLARGIDFVAYSDEFTQEEKEDICIN